jgi:hypothetical protein
LRAEIATIFGPNVVAISATQYKSIQNLQTVQGYIFRILQHFATKLCNFTHFSVLFPGIYFFCQDKKLVYDGNCLLMFVNFTCRLLERNPLHCTCDLLWLSRFLRKLKQINSTKKSTCSTPSHLEHRALVSLTPEDLNCSEPKFIKIPLDIVISSRPPSRAYFYCQASGHPTPTITWLKNRVQLDTDEHYVILDDGTLEIHQPGKDDEATYHCLARNSAGQKVSGARLMYYEEEGGYYHSVQS